MDPYEQHLIALREELARRGVRCELDDRGIWPWLRIYCPGETPGADFDNNVVTAPFGSQWCYCWPSATPIGPVTHLTQAAETIIDELGIDDGEDQEGESAGRALAALRAELDDRGMATQGMTITSLQGTMTLAGGPAVGYRCG